jgi:replicative DNA helicase
VIVLSLLTNDDIRRRLDSIAHVGSERAVLSIAMNNAETLFDIATELDPSDFSNFPNQTIYQIMLSILDNKYSNIGKVNPMIVNAIAQNSGVADDIGGMQYLEILQKSEAGEENLKFYIDKVRQASIRRESFKKAVTVLEESTDCEDEDIETFISRQEEKFLDIVMQTRGTDEVVRIGDLIDVVLEKRETAPKETIGMPTGFAEYDKATGGLVPGRLKVWSATAKTGKSALALNVAKHVAVNCGLPVLYIDTEMPTEEQIDRLVSIVATEAGTPVPERLITSGMYTKNPKMKEAIDDYAKPLIKNSPFFHVYMTDFSAEKIHNLARKFQRQHGISWNGYDGQFLLIFDYIKMDDDSMKKGNMQEYQILGQITNTLKNKTAGQLGIPVLAFAQLNPRSAYGQDDVNSSHMSGSNRIVMYANELAFLRKKTDEEKAKDGQENGNLVFKLGETRNGGSYTGWLDYSIYQGVPRMKEIRNISLEG